MKEHWKTIELTDGYYEASNLGNIRRTMTQRILSPAKVRGYRFVLISIEGNKQNFGVHQLVADAFIGPCPKGKEVNHKDLDKSNNYYKNLEYKTHKKNMQHALDLGVKFGNQGKCKGENSGRTNLTWQKVNSIRKSRQKGLTIKEISNKYNVGMNAVWFIITNKTWKTQ